MHVAFMDTPDDPYALPLDELVHRTLQLLSKHTRLIVWGALLDQYLGLPRIQKVLSSHLVLVLIFQHIAECCCRTSRFLFQMKTSKSSQRC